MPSAPQRVELSPSFGTERILGRHDPGGWKATLPAGESEAIRIRPLGPDDSLDELTELLHRAYQRLAVMGLNFTAVDQESSVTRGRAQGGTCLVAEVAGAMVGTVTYYPPGGKAYCAWYACGGVGHLGQFAVLPGCQRRGIGGQLLDAAEALAAHDGAKELALDTAEPAVHLTKYYEQRGYRLVGHEQWEGKTYRSVIMSKTLATQIPDG